MSNFVYPGCSITQELRENGVDVKEFRALCNQIGVVRVLCVIFCPGNQHHRDHLTTLLFTAPHIASSPVSVIPT